MKSVKQHRFSEVPNVEIPRSKFNRSHGYKTSFDGGYLVPIFIDEALPGDTFSVNLTGFARLSTPIYPVMDNMIMDTFFFAVPNRLIWDNWQKFCGEQTDPGDPINYTVPTVPINNIGNETLFDYFGLPTKIAASYDANNFAGRSYNLIWNEWFRDQNLQDSVTVDKGNGPDTLADYELLRRGKRHDYFTSALPFLQKGDAVQLSLGTSADIVSAAVFDDSTNNNNVISLIKEGTANKHSLDSSGGGLVGSTSTGGYPNVYADLQTATASTVNELRQAVQVQRLLEREARSGTRYIEIVKSHFGVTGDDARFQRPEYLGGGSSPISIGAVARTDSSPGVLGATGTVGFKNHGFVKSFSEHCTIIGLVCVRADLTYQEGLDRMWSRQTKLDYYWPTLSHLGEQSILNKEIYLDAAGIGAGTDEDVFAYQERYAEYRYKPSKITGKMRSNDAASLDAWHLGIEFGAQPTFDDSFIVETPPIDRIIATPSEPHFIFDSIINMECTRPMPMYSVPGLIDHF